MRDPERESFKKGLVLGQGERPVNPPPSADLDKILRHAQAAANLLRQKGYVTDAEAVEELIRWMRNQRSARVI